MTANEDTVLLLYLNSVQASNLGHFIQNYFTRQTTEAGLGLEQSDDEAAKSGISMSQSEGMEMSDSEDQVMC